MEAHVGKKRRKEVRRAIDLKTEMNRLLRRALIFLAIAVVVYIVLMILMSKGLIDTTSTWTSMIPMIVVLIFAMVVGSQSYKWYGLRDQYKKHCKRFDISKKDMKDLKEGRL